MALNNSTGLVMVDNTVGGAVIALGNSGGGLLPGQEEPVISGDHS